MPKKALIIRNVDGIELNDLKVALKGIKIIEPAPPEFKEVHALINSSEPLNQGQLLRALHLFKLQNVRDYLYETIKNQTGNHVIYHLNGINDSGEINEINVSYITSKLEQISHGTDFDMMYLGGGHGDPQRGSSNLSKQQLVNITNTLKTRHSKFSAVVLGSCFSAAYSGLYQPLLQEKGVMISNSLECGASNNFRQVMELMNGDREVFFSEEDIRSAKRGPTEARSGVKRMLERAEFQDKELDDRFELIAYAKHTAQEISTLRPLDIKQTIQKGEELSRAFGAARNALIGQRALFYSERNTPRLELPENMVREIFKNLGEEFQTSINVKLREYRTKNGLSVDGKISKEEYQKVVFPMVELSAKIKGNVGDQLRTELNSFISVMQASTDPVSKEKIKELLNEHPMLKDKITSMINKQMELTRPPINLEQAEEAIFNELKYRITQPPATSIVLSTSTSISMIDFRTFPERPPNAEESFRTDFAQVLSQIEGSRKFAEVHPVTEHFDGVLADKQFNELFAQAVLKVEKPEKAVGPIGEPILGPIIAESKAELVGESIVVTNPDPIIGMAVGPIDEPIIVTKAEPVKNEDLIMPNEQVKKLIKICTEYKTHLENSFGSDKKPRTSAEIDKYAIVNKMLLALQEPKVDNVIRLDNLKNVLTVENKNTLKEHRESSRFLETVLNMLSLGIYSKLSKGTFAFWKSHGEALVDKVEDENKQTPKTS